MSPPPIETLSESWHADDRWLRGLARRLVHDPGLADDLVQETWLTRLCRPDIGTVGMGWLATVMRNRRLVAGRSAERRRRHEGGAAPTEAQPSTAEVVERIAVRHDVVRAVLSLDEPYRETVLLRFYEDLPPRRIAQRMGVPVSTVKTRLQRGIARLRDALDNRHGGDRHAWTVALISFEKSSAAATTLGAMLMSLSVIGLTAAVVVVACLAFVDDETRDVNESVVAAPDVRAEAPALEERMPDVVRDVFVTSSPVAEVAPEAAPPAPPADAVWTGAVHGRLFDLDGRPIPFGAIAASVEVRDWREPGSLLGTETCGTAKADADGRFVIEVQSPSAGLYCADPDRITVYAGTLPDAPGLEVTVVVTARRVVEGIVSDENGTPIVDAEVSIELDRSADAFITAVLDRSTRQRFETRSAADGTFHFEAAPGCERASVRVDHAAYETTAVPLPADGVPVRVVLSRPPHPARIFGRVVDANGAAVEDAVVVHGHAFVHTDSAGRFELAADGIAAEDRSIRAAKAGHAPAELLRPPEGFPSPLLLRLGPSPSAIEGIVVDAEGRPKGSVRVGVLDPSAFGVVDHVARNVEDVIGTSGEHVRTGDDGRFRLDGLLDRPYRLIALDLQTFDQVTTHAIAPGATSVRIEFAGRGRLTDVSGRVVTRHGSPVAGARVAVGRRLHGVQYLGGSTGELLLRPFRTTDAEGRFTIHDCPRSGVEIEVDGAHVMPTYVPVEPGADLRIVVPLRLHLRVETREPAARYFAIVDELDQRLTLMVFRGSTIRNGTTQMLEDGASPVVALSDAATTVVLYSSDNAEVGRRPIVVADDDVIVVADP